MPKFSIKQQPILIFKTYDEFMKKLAGRGLGKVTDSGQSPGGLSSGDLLGFNQFLDQHDSGVAARLDDAINEQSPASGNIKINY
jgi:hypothetical protein